MEGQGTEWRGHPKPTVSLRKSKEEEEDLGPGGMHLF